MIKKLIIFFTLLLIHLQAQVEFDISGYAVNMPIYQPAKDLGIVNLKDQS
jgi:hypothetical protein